ncbi:MAG: hypothetical protein ACOZB3_02810 [Calditrichota bacterium]
MSSEKPTQACIDSQVGALLIPYALSTLRDEDIERFELHLLHCPACQAELEAAAAEIEMLASTRDEFVQRAYSENEDFESQYERLRQTVVSDLSRTPIARTPNWLEMTWEVLWRRKWVVGAVGAVAVAILFGIRPGPESIPPPYAINDVPLGAKSSSKPPAKPEGMTALPQQDPAEGIVTTPEHKAVIEQKVVEVQTEVFPQTAVTVTPQASGIVQPEQVNAPATDRITETAESAKPESAPYEPLADKIESTGQTRAVTEISSLLKKQPGFKVDPERASEPKAPLAESVTEPAQPELLPNEVVIEYQAPQVKVDVSSKEVRISGAEREERASASELVQSAELQQMADLALGKLDPGMYTLSNDTYSLAAPAKQSGSVTDTTVQRTFIEPGVSALTEKKYSKARELFQSAYNRLPAGTQRDEADLLLIRTLILTGHVDTAKERLRSREKLVADSSRQAEIRQAIVTIDSLQAVQPRK